MRSGSEATADGGPELTPSWPAVLQAAPAPAALPAAPEAPARARVPEAPTRGHLQARVRWARPSVPPERGPRWLSRAIVPSFIVLDVGAWAAGVALVGSFDGLHVALLVVVLLLLAAAGEYKSRLSLYLLQSGSRIAGRTLVAGALVAAVDLLVRGPAAQDRVVRTALLVAVLLCLVRGLAYRGVRAARAAGLVTHRTLVLGAGRVGVQIVELLVEHPEYGLRPVGFLDEQPLVAETQLPVPLLGGADVLASTITQYGIEDVIVAFGGLPGHELVEVIRTCDRLECEIFFVPRLYELHATAQGMDAVWGMPLMRHRRAAFRSVSWRVKRLLDVLASAAALLVLAPFLLVVGVAVLLESGPGIIFRQERVGLDGRPFQLLKFRSLRPTDESESATRWNVALDDRMGPVGRFLRQTSLDELPQLWNILRGDMSLVGPRPERPHFVSSFSSVLPRYLARHRVPAGLTGWAQVHGLRGDTSIADRARFDNYYIENWSLGLDLRILLMTVASVIKRAGG